VRYITRDGGCPARQDAIRACQPYRRWASLPEIIRIGPLELRFLCSKHESNGSLDLFQMTVPPSGRMPVPHYHRNWDETVYGLAGIVTFATNGASHDIGPGGSLFIGRGVVHGFENRSGAPATCLCVLTPGVLGPEYFRELADLIAAGPPDEGARDHAPLRSCARLIRRGAGFRSITDDTRLAAAGVG
jgi:quercetin dioxygenase-like cupin family protein